MKVDLCMTDNPLSEYMVSSIIQKKPQIIPDLRKRRQFLFYFCPQRQLMKCKS